MNRVRRSQFYHISFSARSVWECILLVFLFSSILYTFSAVAQESDGVLQEAVPVVIAEPSSENNSESISESLPEPTPVVDLEPVSALPSSPEPTWGTENSSWESSLPPEDTSSPAVWDIVSDVPTSSITLLDTGDWVTPTLEWVTTAETDEILSTFSNNDVFVEIEVIFSELDTETDAEIQNDPMLADNTDEDPNVDLIDPSIIPNPAGPLPEPDTELPPEDTTPVLESPEASQSTIALLESLFESEELSVRRYEKDVILDESATHTCRADIFRADLQAESSSRARVTLFQNKKKLLPSYLEIGALPAGIDVVFKGNNDYTYTPGTRETLIEFEITRQIGAREGDFTIPIIYTLMGDTQSSVVCQINIIND